MTYSGTIVYIGDTKQVTDKFQTREFVLSNTEEKYPQEVKMQMTQKNCALLDNYKVGDNITVHFNLSGRRYEKNGQTTWFTTVVAWKIDGAKSAAKLPEVDYTNAFDDVVPF